MEPTWKGSGENVRFRLRGNDESCGRGWTTQIWKKKRNWNLGLKMKDMQIRDEFKVEEQDRNGMVNKGKKKQKDGKKEKKEKRKGRTATDIGHN